MNSIVIYAAGDQYEGDPEFTVDVNGVQIGGTYDVSALYSSSIFQAFTITGTFLLAPDDVISINYVNDLYGSTGDRNLYINSINADGTIMEGAVAALVTNGVLPNAGALWADGSLNFVLPSASTPTTEDTLVINAAGDQYQGDPEFTVDVDGVQVGGTYAVSELYSSGNFEGVTLTGNFDITPDSELSINFINDSYGPGGDRNLYIGSIEVNGRTFQGSAAATGTNGDLPNAGALWADGSLNFNLGGVSLLGVNFSGAEEGFAIPTDAEIGYYASKGLNIFRLPFSWESLQPTLNGPLDTTVLSQIEQLVSYASSLGVKVILDVHNYGDYNGNPIGSSAVPISSFANLWGKLAGQFANNPDVLFGLMNEPNLPATTWLSAANSAIAAIRATGATSQTVLVSGVDYDIASTWLTSGNATTIGAGIVDPNNNYAFEVHQYLDSNGSGVGSDTVSPTIGVDSISDVTEWAQQTGQKLFLGEFGANSDTAGTTALNNMLAYMAANSSVWLGGTEWESGTNYNYYFNMAPVNGVDSAQTQVLDRYAPNPDTTGTTAPTPVLTGVSSTLSITQAAPLQPFQKINVTDAAQGVTYSVSITLSNAAGVTDADGTLSGTGLYYAGVGTYQMTATSVSALASALSAIVFTPTQNQISVTTALLLSVNNTVGTSTLATSIVATESGTIVPPSVTGLAASTTLLDDVTALPFAGVTITDAQANTSVSASITLESGGVATTANGTLAGTGLTQLSAGVYALGATTPSTLSAELAGLVFTPVDHEVTPGSSVTTDLSVTVSGQSTTTTVTSALVAQASFTAPVVSGLAAQTSLGQNATATPFSAISVSDPDDNASTSAVITFSNDGMATDADGLLSGAGLTHTGVGTYSLAATTPSRLAAELAGLVFTPTISATNSVVTTLASLTLAEGDATTTATMPIVATRPAALVDNVTVALSEDAYDGDAQGLIKIDGTQIGGSQTITALNALGLSDQLTFIGDFGVGTQDISIQFINDAYGGSSALDRNLYVDFISLNGTQIADTYAPLYANSTANFSLTLSGTPPGSVVPTLNSNNVTSETVAVLPK
jgi:endoglucanase